MPELPALPADRLELELHDAKPTYSAGAAQAEAERCLYCHDAPCIQACPTEIDIPTFIKKIATGNVRGSAKTIFEQNMLGYSCARVCPVEVLCVGACVYNDWHRAPIQIGKLQRFATERALADEKQSGRKLFTAGAAIGKKVALIGAGPASLACAAYLRIAGVETVVFERGAVPGGLNTTGVAPYKMHADDSIAEVGWLSQLGVRFEFGREVGRDPMGADLLREYDAVFIGVGLGADSTMKVSGLEGPGVVGATEFIARVKNEKGFALPGVKHALVIGGGNTAIDVARELSQLGVANVMMVYRRGLAAMSGYVHEMDAARRERVILVDHALPSAVLRKDGAISALRVVRTDDHGNPRAGAEVELPADLIVVAIGQSKLSAIAKEFAGVTVDARGCVQVDAVTRRSANTKVYAGGDCINGGMEVVNAAADGREAAKHMLESWGK